MVSLEKGATHKSPITKNSNLSSQVSYFFGSVSSPWKVEQYEPSRHATLKSG